MDFATIPIRLARPSRDLEAARRFWVDGLGLDVLWQTGPDGEGGHALLMVGPRGAAWHLELVSDPVAHSETRPGPEDLVVLYLGTEFDSARGSIDCSPRAAPESFPRIRTGSAGA
jgi:catechol 2,3-dioxygenase-like lactoylglutathione lyase family enzyme